MRCDAMRAPANLQMAQVHLAHISPRTMAVQYVTRSVDSRSGLVEFGLDQGALNLTTQATNKTYTDGGFQGWIWSAVMDDLSVATRYYYR